jgi:hypothetical protein
MTETAEHDHIRAWASRASRRGWEVKLRRLPGAIPTAVAARYRRVPASYRAFLALVERCLSDERDLQILCAHDFADVAEADVSTTYRWDEFERISVEAAEADGFHDLAAAAKAFWDRHLPIGRRVANGYAYFAISMADASVVTGCEPEFEDSAELAHKDFRAFLAAQL